MSHTKVSTYYVGNMSAIKILSLRLTVKKFTWDPSSTEALKITTLIFPSDFCIAIF